MEFARFAHFRKNLEEEYRNNRLKTLTISHMATRQGDTELIEYVIELNPKQSILKIYLQDFVPLHMFLIAHEQKFEVETEYSEKTLVKEIAISMEETQQFLHCLFQMYDIRLLEHESLERHPASPIMLDGHQLNTTVSLEWSDGYVDSVTFEEDSVAESLLKTAGLFCENLKKLLIYKVW